MSSPGGSQRLPSGETLLKQGRSLRILALSVIVVLSVGMAILVYGQLQESGLWGGMMENPKQLLGGFALLMLLTVGYLVGKGWVTSRDQHRLINQLLEEETLSRAQRLNPLTQFHHPEVCRDILLRQAHLGARHEIPLSVAEVSATNLGKLSLGAATRPRVEELVGQIRRLCRPVDSLLRWTPDSFLLVLPEIGREELPPIGDRIQQELAKWCEEHWEAPLRPSIQWRGFTSDKLEASGDILFEIQRQLEMQTFAAALSPEALSRTWRREKSVGLAVPLEVEGVDQNGAPFRESIVTERVATDRIWFTLGKTLSEQCSLTVAAPDGSFRESATVVRLIERGGQQVIEAQFAKTPERWVLRSS